MMTVDVSEVKEFRHCKRKWQLSSRNQFHIRPVVTPTAFKLGTIFHDSLHKLYLGKDIEEVVKYISSELDGPADDKDRAMLISMITGYNNEVYPEDAKVFKVLDIEHHFKLDPKDCIDAQGWSMLRLDWQFDELLDVQIAGSIDMIALNTVTNEIWGFEHKTAKNFRNEVYLWMDEQPRLYYAALQQYVAQLNARRYSDWVYYCKAKEAECAKLHMPVTKLPSSPAPYKVGGVYINEVRKLVRAFDCKRSALKYDDDDLRNFMIAFLTSCAECHKMVAQPDSMRLPTPDMMTCMTCQYNTICQAIQYKTPDKDFILKEFSKEYKERETDHLEEKTEVNNNVVE